MPPVAAAVASIAAAVGGAGVYLTGSALIGNALVWGTQAILGYGLTTALTYAANRALTKKATSSALSVSRSQMVKQPLAPLQIVYGEVRVSGPLIFPEVSGTNNEYLHLIVALAGHEVNAIGDVYINDEVLTLSGENATGTYAGLVRVKKFLGVAAGERDTDLETESGGQWTSAHLGKGIARLHIRLKWDQDKFPGGIPNFSAIVQGAKVYDPRTATTGYSNNWALCVRDYLVRTDGLGADAAEINLTACNEAANVSDEDVELADASTEKRYTVNGVIDTSQAPREVIAALATAGAGVVAYIGGEWVIHAGAYRTPTVTLDENDLRGPISVQTKISRREIFNGVKGVFVSPENQWQPADFPPVVNATYTTEDGGERIWRDVDLPFTTSSATAQRLAKIELERIRQQITVKLPCNLNALKVQVGDVVQITNTRMGWSAKVFEVVEFTFVPEPQEGGGMALGVDLVLRETASGVWDWNDGEETTIDLAPNTNLYNPRSVPAASGLTLLSDNTTGIVQGDGTFVPRLRVTWSAPSDAFVTAGGRTVIEYKVNGAADWIEWAAPAGSLTQDFITDIKTGNSYDVRVKHRNASGVSGAYDTETGYAISTDQTPPGAPTGLTVSAEPDGLRILCTAPTDADTARLDFYVSTSAPAPGDGTSPSFSMAVRPGDTLETRRSGLTAGTTYYVFARARDASGNKSSWTAAQTGVPSTASAFVLTSLDGKNRTYYQASPPSSGMIEGDTWFDSDDLNRIYRYQSGSWVDVQKVLEESDFGTGIEPVKVLASLPAAGTQGRVVFLTSDNKLYRDTGSGWTAVVPTTDLSGTITTTQITDDAVTTPKLNSGAVTADKVAASAITTDKLDANAVTAGKIAAGAITADKVGANEIITTAANIGNAVITSAKIASLDAGKINAGTLAAMTLTAAKTATDTEFFNTASPSSTFPSVAMQQHEDATTRTSLGTGGTEIWLTTFYGWATGSGFVNDRYGKSAMKFICLCNAGGTVASGSYLDLEIIYRKNGGSTVQVNPFAARALDDNGSLNLSGALSLTGLTGTDTVDFGYRAKSDNNSTSINVVNLVTLAINV